MPQKPKRPCRYPGCPGFCEQGQVFCKDHRMYSDDRMRGSASARGYDARWREARALFLFLTGETRGCSGIRQIGNLFARNAMIRKPEVGCEAFFRLPSC